MHSVLCPAMLELKCFLGGICKKLKHLIIYLPYSGQGSCLSNFLIEKREKTGKKCHIFVKPLTCFLFSPIFYVCKTEPCVGWVYEELLEH